VSVHARLLGEGPVALVGVGNLGGALLEGLLATATLTRADVRCVVRRAERAAELVVEQRVVAGTDVAEAVRGAATVVLGVKPQTLPEVLPEVAAALEPGALVVSLAAGVSTATIASALPDGARVVRVMTNTPIRVRAAVSVLAAGPAATAQDVERVRALFEPLGRVLVLDESAIDAVTALSGSGPAYVLLLTEALIAGAEALGLAHDDAVALAVGTVSGTGALLEAGGAAVDPAALRRAVTSPAGTTAAALAVLEDADVVGAVARAMAAAAARSAELGA
jgi:pyrroline-5-carboxylate reductase